jgi:hypothetical protein
LRIWSALISLINRLPMTSAVVAFNEATCAIAHDYPMLCAAALAHVVVFTFVSHLLVCIDGITSINQYFAKMQHAAIVKASTRKQA